ncbi:MAG: hypothetical protein M1305_03290 [Candidatus Marsarchaeota archaeon]|nr:hypothetical protein [Candidatus Marsarchaeota archaeon]
MRVADASGPKDAANGAGRDQDVIKASKQIGHMVAADPLELSRGPGHDEVPDPGRQGVSRLRHLFLWARNGTLCINTLFLSRFT